MMDDRIAELAKQDYEKEYSLEKESIPNYSKHLLTCAKNRKKRKKRKKSKR